ncbi:MAG: hypothetical protein IT282_16325 [Bacteroidetes bacterium]|nr:hypothetical protein [Bacteroidota bacterium]
MTVRMIMAAGLLLSAAAAGNGGETETRIPNVEGWSMARDSTEYSPETLWEYINGAADLFVSYGFENLAVAYYLAPEGQEIRAEFYRHATRQDAYGMYSQERAQESAPVSYGVEACMDEGMLNFVSGRWYVKLSANEGDDIVQRGMHRVAAAIDSALAQPHELPEGFALLPQAGRIRRSEQYIARDFLGYGFLKGAYVASYGSGDGCRVFAIPHASAELANAALEAFLRVAPRADKGLADGVVRAEDPHHGHVNLVVRGNVLMGVVGCAGGESFRSSLLKNLQ